MAPKEENVNDNASIKSLAGKAKLDPAPIGSENVELKE